MAWTQMCSRCGQERKPEDFYHHARPDRQRRGPLHCRICTTRRGNPRESKSAQHRRLRYGVGDSEIEALLGAQGHRCAVCRRSVNEVRGKHKWNVDHDHTTGAVRGILCWGCNVGLGSFNDDPARLRAAADYLEG